ncbi:MAG: hypothetical protein AB7L28_18250 [Kofleriaceae bacterium]
MSVAAFKIVELFEVGGLDGVFVAGEILSGSIERGMVLRLPTAGLFRVKGIGGVRAHDRTFNLALQLIFIDDKHRSRELFEPAATPGTILELEAA